jgi:hypothetical protein
VARGQGLPPRLARRGGTRPGRRLRAARRSAGRRRPCRPPGTGRQPASISPRPAIDRPAEKKAQIGCPARLDDASAAPGRACCRPSAASPRRPGTTRHRRRLPVCVPGTCRQDWQLRHPAPTATPRTSTPATSMPAMTARIASSPRRRQIVPAASPKKTCPNSARKSPAARTTGNGRYSSVSLPRSAGETDVAGSDA